MVAPLEDGRVQQKFCLSGFLCASLVVWGSRLYVGLVPKPQSVTHEGTYLLSLKCATLGVSQSAAQHSTPETIQPLQSGRPSSGPKLPGWKAFLAGWTLPYIEIEIDARLNSACPGACIMFFLCAL